MGRVRVACALAIGGAFLIISGVAHGAYADVTAGSGIAYTHADVNQVPPSNTIRQGRVTKTIVSNFAGAAAVDVDGDGWTDFLGARYNLPPVLYINQRNGTFTEEAAARGLGSVVNAGSFGAGDLDNDGDQDLFIALHRGPRFFLFLNDGSGHFSEAAVARGADVTTTIEDHEAYSIGLVDYDRDGFLDIYVSEWGVLGSAENALHSVLLRNRGAAQPGFFDNVTAAAGLVQPLAGANEHFGFSSGWADFDDDGWPDLALVADFGRSRLYWNNGNGTFTDGTIAAGVGVDEFGMGVAVGDYNGDGRIDFYVTSIDEPFFTQRIGTHTGNKLYRNLGSRHFAEVAASSGAARAGWGWGAAFLEFDNDGDLDLVATNGMDAAELGPTGPYYAALTDPTTVFQNGGNGDFADITNLSGVGDTGLGKAVVVWDYDNDGDEDFVVTNTFGSPVVYRSDATTNGREWIRFKLRGTASNRDGIGAVVRVTNGAKTQTSLFNPTNAFLGQREGFVHFGVGTAGGAVDAVTVTWPSGTVQQFANPATNTLHLIVEPPAAKTAPVITLQPVLGGAAHKDDTVELTVAASGDPAPVYVWEKNGVTIPGANQPTLRLARIHPFDAGSYRVHVINTEGTVTSDEVEVAVTIDLAEHSPARWWNEFLLDSIRKDIPNPPVHARNLYHMSAAMWDAFWAYEEEGWTNALPVFHREVVSPADWIGGREAAQAEALSHAAFRIISERFKNSVGKVRTLFGARWLMERYGFDPDFTGTSGNSPAAVGNRIGYAVLAATLHDGANEAGGYGDITGYAAVNEPMIVALRGTTMNDPSRWQPLALRYSVTQSGIPLPESVQSFVGVNAIYTTPFALEKPTPTSIALDPGPPPQFGTETHAAFVQEALDCIQMSSLLDPTDGVMVDISPGDYLNNPLGTNDGIGHAINPVTGQPYAPNLVKRGDYTRVLAEFWADGPASETPPGHWNVVFNEVSDHPLCEHRYAGEGAPLPRLEWDVRGYLALNGATHDAACAAWGVKRLYDSARPISMIRYLGGLGQSSDPAGPAYDPDGLPLIAGLIEVVTAETAAPGQRHAHLADSIGKVAIRAWKGNPTDPRTQIGGVDWILATEWVPYQLPTFVSPAFPGYVSGHSTFSRSAAEVLTLFTGSPFFPGGLGEFHFTANEFLTFEIGPSTDLTLQWATYYDAADQAGISRLFGGIHPSVDDFNGRRLGSQIGLDAFLKAHAMRSAGGPPPGLVNLSSRGRSGSGDEVMIAGFVIEGTEPQPTLLRTVGPELHRLGVPLALCEIDPRLELHRASDDAVLLTNDNWSASPRASAIADRALVVGAFTLSPGGTDAAELTDLAPGIYTVISRSSDPAARGIALAEVYGQNLVNLSTRGSVGAGDNALIAGFVVTGTEPTAVLVRAVGPTLEELDVPGWLPDPVLQVFHHRDGAAPELIAQNDDWTQGERASLAGDAARRTGAFALPLHSRDAALFLQLPPGIYSAVVRSADATEGIALAEVYHVK